jgi:hypothetical protein
MAIWFEQAALCLFVHARSLSIAKTDMHMCTSDPGGTRKKWAVIPVSSVHEMCLPRVTKERGCGAIPHGVAATLRRHAPWRSTFVIGFYDASIAAVQRLSL